MGGQKNAPEPAPAALHRVRFARQGSTTVPRHDFLCLSLASGSRKRSTSRGRYGATRLARTHDCARAHAGSAQFGAAPLLRLAGRQLRRAAGVGKNLLLTTPTASSTRCPFLCSKSRRSPPTHPKKPLCCPRAHRPDACNQWSPACRVSPMPRRAIAIKRGVPAAATLLLSDAARRRAATTA